MRSGTTLLHQIVCLSPDTHPFISEGQYLTVQLGVYANFLGERRVYVDDYFGGPAGLKNFTKDIIERFIKTAWNTLDKPAVLAMKNPELAFYFPLLAEFYPAARFLLAVRDPKDTLASMIAVQERQSQDGGGGGFLSESGRDIERLCTSYRSHYRPVLEAIKQGKQDMANRTLFVRYEDVVLKTEDVLSQLKKFCSLSFADAAIDHGWRMRHDFSAIKNDERWGAYLTKLHGQPISAESIGHYKTVLTEKEAAFVDEFLAPERKSFRYG